MATQRRYKLQATDTPASLAILGGGDKADLYPANMGWCGMTWGPSMSTDSGWNPGMEIILPPNWKPIPGEYPGPA
jgi:hypothetical protein